MDGIFDGFAANLTYIAADEQGNKVNSYLYTMIDCDSAFHPNTKSKFTDCFSFSHFGHMRVDSPSLQPLDCAVGFLFFSK
jgi:hypothetical protein